MIPRLIACILLKCVVWEISYSQDHNNPLKGGYDCTKFYVTLMLITRHKSD